LDGIEMAKRMKVQEIINLIQADGWFLIKMRGSHRQYKHPSKKGKVTVPGHPSDTLNPKTQASILQQAQLED
jgi:predicted RNA binding protein YcfA (HicA-like mRNA interferase family)